MKQGFRVWPLAIFGGLLALLMAAARLPTFGDKPIGDELTGDEQPNLQAAVDAMKGGEHPTGDEHPNLQAAVDAMKGGEHPTGDEHPNLQAAVDAMKGGEHPTGDEHPNLQAAVDAMKGGEPTGDEQPTPTALRRYSTTRNASSPRASTRK